MAIIIRGLISVNNGNNGIQIEGDARVEMYDIVASNNGMDGLNLNRASNVSVHNITTENNFNNGITVTEQEFKSTAEVFEFFGINESKVSESDFINALNDAKRSLDQNIRPEIISTIPSFSVFKQGTLDATTIIANIVTISPLIPSILKLFGF